MKNDPLICIMCTAIIALAAVGLNVPNVYAALSNKTLIYCSEGSPTGFDPSQATLITDYTTSAYTIYNRLVEFERGATKIVPGLAMHWDISPDALNYTFNLRQDVRFHTTSYFKPTRGFNADDVIFTFERMRDPEHIFNKAYGVPFPYFVNLGLDKEIVKIEKLDQYTVRFTLRKANAPFLMNLGLAFASILSAEYADWLLKDGRAADINWQPIGTGPYIFHSYNRDATIRFDGNPYYWEPANVKVSKLNFIITPDPAVRVQKLKKDECHIASYPRPDDLAIIKSDPNLKLISQPGLNLSFLAYNVLHKPLDNTLVRRALDMAINKEAIVNTVFDGHAQVATEPAPPVLWPYKEELQNVKHSSRLQKAKKLLAQAGYPKGFSISLWAMSVQRPYNPNAKLMAAMIQSDWKKIGVKTHIVSHEWGEYIKRVHAGEHDALLIGWIGNSDMDDWLGTLLTCNAITGVNYPKWCHPAFDALVNTARQTTDIDKRMILYQEARKIFKRELPFTPIAHSIIYQSINKKVTGFKVNPLSPILFMGVGLE